MGLCLSNFPPFRLCLSSFRSASEPEKSLTDANENKRKSENKVEIKTQHIRAATDHRSIGPAAAVASAPAAPAI